MAKKYYWLKLKNDFFTSKEIKKLRKTAGGDTFVIIYLKMQLLSLQNGGKIFYDGIEDDFASEIALTLDEDPENVRLTMAFLQNCGLIECNEVNECFLTKVPEITGKESDSAQRMRKLRALQSDTGTSQSDNDVTKCDTEIDIEKDTDTEKDKDISLPDKSDRETVSSGKKKKSFDKKQAESDFEECWKIYPKKQGKAKALKAYLKFAEKDPYLKEKVISGINSYNKEIQRTRKEYKFIKNGDTYFCNECWYDEYSEIQQTVIETTSGNGEWDSIFDENF